MARINIPQFNTLLTDKDGVTNRQWYQFWSTSLATITGAVASVTGLNTDNTDPTNPIIRISVDGITITGAGTPASKLTAHIGAGTAVTSLNGETDAIILTSSGGTIAVTTPTANTINLEVSGAGDVLSVLNSDGTLTISPTTGNVVASLALSHANIWVGLQTFGNNISYGGAKVNVTSLTTNDILKYNGTNWVNTPDSTGTVTSVIGTANRITSTGGNTPQIDISASYVGQSSITTLGTITTGVWNGTKIGLAYGGTNADLSATGGTSQYLKQISSGAAITVGTIPASDIASGAALTKIDDTNVTLTLGGAPTTALLAATSITAGWTGTLSGVRGGTGVNNGASTITIGGNVTYSGAFTFACTVTGNTTVTFPTTGTLYGTASGSITSAQLATSLTDETGTGVAVFGTNPTLSGATFADATNIALNTTTGTKIGTATTQKLGFYNATPIVQPTGDVITALQNLGLGASLTVAATTITSRTLWGQTYDGSANVSGSLTAVGNITGGASSMTITAGTGNSRTLALQSTTSGGTATTFLTGNADQSMTFAAGFTGAGASSIGTGNAFTCGTIELGAATDTTLARVSAGVISVEGVTVATSSNTLTLTNKSIVASQITTGTFGTGAYTMDTSLAVPQVFNADNAVTASANAITITRANRNNVVTNNSAATLTVTLSTSGAVAGDMLLVQILDFSAVAQTITWVNTENSQAIAPVTSNGSTTLPISVGFKWNTKTSKWRTLAVS